MQWGVFIDCCFPKNVIQVYFTSNQLIVHTYLGELTDGSDRCACTHLTALFESCLEGSELGVVVLTEVALHQSH